jgi:hypothetical protein
MAQKKAGEEDKRHILKILIVKQKRLYFTLRPTGYH